MVLFIISFVGGILTVLAPCILPLLPVIVGGSLTDGKVNVKKAITVIAALGASVLLFTFLLKASTLFIDIPEYTWKLISGGIVLLLGVVTIFPALWENKLLARLSAKSNILLGKGDQKKSFWGDVIVGAALGPVFSTCSPTYFIVLATVLPVNPVIGTIYLLAYIVGLCLSLLVVTFLGQKIMDKLGVAADPNGIFKRVLGIIFVLVGLAILTGVDKKIETAILNNGFFDVTKIEQMLLEKNTSDEENSQSNTPNSIAVGEPYGSDFPTDKPTKTETPSEYLTLKQKSAKYKTAPEISSPDGFVNTEGKPITLADLKGKVVLLDIWTYSCINCQRTLPYLNNWYEKYRDQGLEIIGLHTPEFSFEKVQSNVERAVKDFGIRYPVVLDNDYSTWRALGNQYWPRKYLIDIDGYIVYDHIGEGAYDETERQIQNVLKERADRIGMKESIPTSISEPARVISVDPGKVKSPEVYFGSSRNEYLFNGRSGVSGTQTFEASPVIISNQLYLDGVWNITSEYSENKGQGGIIFNYEAKNVYITAGSQDGAEVEIYKDDVFVKKMSIKDEELYTLIEGKEYGKHTLRVKIIKGSIKAFTFTFG